MNSWLAAEARKFVFGLTYIAPAFPTDIGRKDQLFPLEKQFKGKLRHLQTP